MEKKIIILHHQGWGDLLICHGIIRYNCAIYQNKKFILVMRDDAKQLVDYMYSDLINCGKLMIDYIPKKYFDIHVLQRNIKNKYLNNEILAYGIHLEWLSNKKYTSIPRNFTSFGHQFYEGYGITAIERINSFEIVRDKKLEEMKYMDVVNHIGKDYIVIHEDIDRDIKIDRQKIVDNGFPLFDLDKKSDILFDMIKIIEHAKEIHLIESTYSIMIYLLQHRYHLFNNIPIYIHFYTRTHRDKGLYENPDNTWIWLY